VSRSALRPALVVFAGALLVGAAALAIAGCTIGAALYLAVPGLVLLFGLLVEPWRYKPLTDGRPGPGWMATDERFIDPESGKLVNVFYKPATGERRYVAVRDGVQGFPPPRRKSASGNLDL
jgi:hypothetical protein